MPRQSNGSYQQPANTAAVSGQSISSTAYNSLITDIGTEITNSLDRGGRSAMTANLPMGGNKATGMADPSSAQDAATKNYVDTLTATFWSTGDVKITLKVVADTGWIFMNDGTFGSASSGASTRANNDTQPLFYLFYATAAIDDTTCPLYTSTGVLTTRAAQGSVATAWAANCRMSLPKTLGRALAVAGAGAGLTTRQLSSALGEETHLLTSAEIPAVAFSGTTGNDSPDHTHGGVLVSTNTYNSPGGATNVVQSANAGSTGGASTRHQHPFSGNISGGGGSHNNMQPSTFFNIMIKL